jgi:hypothetical protein
MSLSSFQKEITQKELNLPLRQCVYNFLGTFWQQNENTVKSHTKNFCKKNAPKSPEFQ